MLFMLRFLERYSYNKFTNFEIVRKIIGGKFRMPARPIIEHKKRQRFS